MILISRRLLNNHLGEQMYQSELDIIEQHNWTEGSKYNQLIKLHIQQKYDEDTIRRILVEEYELMKPKEFKSKWNRFQFIKRKIDDSFFGVDK